MAKSTPKRAAYGIVVSALLLGACAPTEPSSSSAPVPRASESTAQTSGPPRSRRPSLPRFETRLELPLPTVKPKGLLAGDIDGDGSEELIAASQTPGRLHVWTRLSGSATAAPPPMSLETGGYPLGPVWVRPPSEGAPLVAVASQELAELRLFDLGATPGERLVQTVELPGTPLALAAGDLGRGGSPAIVVLTDVGDLVLVDPGGAASQRFLADEQATCARLLEGGDGIVVGFQDTQRLAFLHFDADVPRWADVRPLAESPLWVPLGGIPRDIEEIDLDRDGDLELVVAGGDHALWVFGWGLAGGPAAALTGGAAPRQWETEAIPLDLEVSDVDDDGADELIVLHYYHLDVSVLDDFGPDGPAVVRVEDSGDTPWDTVAGDFDGDGLIDLAVSDRDAYRVSMLLGREPGRFQRPHQVSTGRAPRAITSCDLNGDGSPDAVVLSSIEDSLSVLPNRDGKLEEGGRVVVGSDTDSVRAADVDADGDVDVGLLATDSNGSSLVLLLGDGAGGLTRSALEGARIGAESGDLLLEDLDGDGRVEIVACDRAGGVVSVFRARANGAGMSLELVGSMQLDGAPGALATLDREGDGRLELAVALGGVDKRHGLALLAIEAGPKGGVSLREAGFLETSMAAIDVSPADFDGDGRTDLALLTSGSTDLSPGVVHLWLAMGAGWRELPKLPTSLHPYCLASGDLDGDGRDDLVASAKHSHHVSVWLARPAEPLEFLRLADLGAGRGPLDVELADVDGDGRLDVLVANHYSANVSTVYNRAP